jgi:methyl-accepting chemotaxis protein
VIRGVSQAAQRQSREIDQLARTIQELDQFTHSNREMVGSYTGAASELRGESQRLAGLVTRFKLPGQDAVMHAATPPDMTTGAPLPAPQRQLPR